MKEVRDFVFAKKTNTGIWLYVDEDCQQPYVNSAITSHVEELMKDSLEGDVEMIVL